MDQSIIRSVQFRQATVEREKAYERYNYASSALTLAQVQERAAELASQSFESVAKGAMHKALGPLTEREREIGIAFARYAACGRTD